MKPTEKQIEIAKAIEIQAKFWQSTNDINSPTHHSDIHQETDKLVYDGLISNKQCDELVNLISNIYFFIKNIK